MKSDTPTTARGPGRSRQRACLSSDSSEKISNYLNIWRIAVSSDRALPYPLKPREMRRCIRKDAGGCTNVTPTPESKEATCRVRSNGLQSRFRHNGLLLAKTRVFRTQSSAKDRIKLAARLLTLICPRVVSRIDSSPPNGGSTRVDSREGALTDLVPAVFCCCKLLINK